MRPLAMALLCALGALSCRGGLGLEAPGEDAGTTPPIGPPIGLRLDGVSADQPLDVGAVVQLRVFAMYENGAQSDESAKASVVSSRPLVASVDGLLVLKALAKGTTELRATLGADDASGLSLTVPLTVQDPGAGVTVAVEVTPPALSLAPGFGRALRANGTQADGSQRDVTATATWTSSNPAVCTVDDGARKGFVTAVLAGSCTVLARQGPATGSATVTVEPLTVTALSLAPAALLVPLGQTGRLVATATLSDGSAQDASATATWASRDAGVATVQGGVVKGVAAGETQVTATLGAQSAAATVKVSAAKVVGVSIGPPQVTLAAGLVQQLRATAIYSDGSSVDATAQAAWSSDAPASARVDSGDGSTAGLVHALAPGRATVKATVDGVSGLAIVVVTNATLVKLALQPAALTLPIGTAQRVRAIGTFSDVSTRDVSAEASWSIGDPHIATVDALGNTVGLTKGTTELKATLSGVGATARVDVNDAQLTRILLLPVSLVLPTGLSQRLQATGIYTDNSLHDVTGAATWTSAAPAIATVSNAAGARGTVTGAAAGTTEITAALDGVTSGPVPVTVSASTLLSVLVRPGRQTVPRYQSLPVRLTARYSDGSEYDQTNQATFTSDQPAIASVVATGPGAGWITGIARGTATIRGTLSGLSDTARADVIDATVQSVTVQAQRDTMRVGDSQALRCIVRYLGSPQAFDETPLCAWTSSDTAVARFNAQQPGLVIAVAPGSFTVGAQILGISGTRALRVDPTEPQKLEVIESPITLPRGVTRALIALATYPDGRQADLTYGAEWSSDANAVAVVGNNGLLKGLVTGVSPGLSSITARVGTVSGTGQVTVSDAKATALSIAPVNPIVTSPGGPFQPTRNFPFYATAHFDDGSDQNVTAAVVWLTSDPFVVTISNSAGSKGRADILSAGGASVSAVLGALKATTFLTSR